MIYYISTTSGSGAESANDSGTEYSSGVASVELAVDEFSIELLIIAINTRADHPERGQRNSVKSVRCTVECASARISEYCSTALQGLVRIARRYKQHKSASAVG